MVMETLSNTPAGPIEKIPNLTHRKQARYWRLHTDEAGNTSWEQTQPLPADTAGKELYLGKGFRLTPPDAKVEQAQEPVDPEREALYAENARLREMLKEAKGKPKKRANSE